MRIAFVSQGLGRIDPPHAYGSISIWTYGIINELRRTDEVIAYEMDGGLFTNKTKHYQRVKYIYAPTLMNRVINRCNQEMCSGGRIKTKLSVGGNVQPFSSPLHNFGYILWVARDLRKQKCDVVHIHQFSQYAPVVRYLNPKAKIVLHMNCEWLSQLDKSMIAKRLASVDVILGCSGHITNKIVKRSPYLEQKCGVIYNGADMDRFGPPGQGVTIEPHVPLPLLFVGRISPEKGVHILVEAFAMVAKDFPTATLELVGGTGSMPEEFLVSLSDEPAVQDLKKFYGRDYVAELKNQIPASLKDRVRFHGNVAHRELMAHYKRASVFVISSLSDAFPLTVVEAMASGVPVVASAVGGIPEAVLNEESGLLVEPNSPKAFATALARVLADTELRRRLAAAAHDRAAKVFSWQSIARNLKEVYRSAVTDPRQCAARKMLLSEDAGG